MKIHPAKRLLSLVLALVLVLGLVPCAAAEGLVWHETAMTVAPDQSHRLVGDTHQAELGAPSDTIRVSIILEDAPTIGAGFPTRGIALDQQAVRYDRELNRVQKAMERTIAAQALGGKRLDVVWNLTLVANIISANVPGSSLDAIRAVPGVKEVRPERKYSADTAAPQTAVSGGMTGAAALWQSGFTGAGSRVAIIDTGTDTDHQSFDNGAFLHALALNAADRGLSFEQYLAQIDLLDAGDVNRVLEQMNVTERIGCDDASYYYLNEKLPFAANYVDRNLVVDHDHDYQGSHGSHVAGIAAANRFIPANGSYADAQETVSVAGAAPDAQIITMKVFGNAEGPYDSDYFAAIEDAIWLGCDSVNLSLGSGIPGSSCSGIFDEVMEFLETTDTVVVMSAGNSGRWADQTAQGRLYADGVSFHTAGEPGTYTNSLAVASVDSGSGEAYTLSDFSSWGVPGSLELKPEITAPGGMIYSVDGVDTSGKAYEYMSGTSMAAPQVTGMTAQLAQYIREQGLEERTGLSLRQLAQSLLMSTAVPLREESAGGSYYPVLAQGAGLARVDLAASAESCVLVEGQEDGKVKAELGEDARREGRYDFSFTLQNLTDAPVIYELRADLFTQNIFTEGSAAYLDTATRDLPVQADFSCDGRDLSSLGDADCDLNGDRITNAADADYLLEYLLGNVQTLHADGDLDKNGTINTYDAHLLLAMQTDGHSLALEAGGSATVEVTLTLTDETRALLEGEYPAGAYIEGYVYAEPVRGVTHSIPVLGYYGSWTDAGMFDVGGWVEQVSGAENRKPYLYDLLGAQSNYVSVNYGDGREYLFGGNPFVEEDEYLPRRNAFNNEKGAMLQNMRFSLIRNAENTRLTLKNVTGNEVIFSEEPGAYYGAYYHVNLGSWQEIQHRISLGMDLSSFPENTTLELSLEAAPELYRTADGEPDWTRVQDGGTLSTMFTIDNTAPQVLDIHQEGSELRIRARDNQYIAAVALLNAAGTETLAIIPGNQDTPDTALDAAVELSGVFGGKFLVAVFDYAQNQTVCEVHVEQSAQRPRFTIADRETGDWYGLNDSGTAVELTDGNAPIQAAEYVDGCVFRVDDQNRLWVGSDADLYSCRFLSELDAEGRYDIVAFNDLAYCTQNKTLYGNYYSDRNDQEVPFLCTIDLYTGQMTELGVLSVDVRCMTIDDSGNFYAVGNGNNRLYTFRADTITTKKFTQVGILEGYATTRPAPLAWDHELDELYWAFTNDSGTQLLKLDPGTAAPEHIGSYPFRGAGLYIAGSTVGNTFAPTNRVTAVKLPPETHTIAGGTVQLTAQVLPWNVSDDSVTWSSGNTGVATVDANGLVTGISGGTAVITAVSKLDSTKKAACTVTVEQMDSALKGIVWDAEGGVWFSSFDSGTLPAYRKLAGADVPLSTTAYHNGVLYAGTIDTANGTSELYTVDPGTFALTKVGGSDALAYTDLCYAPKLGYLMATYFEYIALVEPTTGEYIGAFEWSGGISGDLVGITYMGSEYSEDYSAWIDTFLILDNRGNVYTEGIMPYNGSFANFNGPEQGLIGSMGDAVDMSFFQGFHFDGNYLYWSRFNEADDIVELRMMDVLGDGTVYRLGYFPEKVWPVGGLYTDAQIGANALSTEFATRSVRAQIASDGRETLPAGGLNSVATGSSGKTATVQVDVTYDGSTTNGIFRVEYDASRLSYTGLKPGTEGCAVRTENGAVEVAFAGGSAIPSGSRVASLSFRVKDGVFSGETAFTIRTRELGQTEVSLTEKLSVTIPLQKNPFVDVKEGSYYHIPVLWAVQRGITVGTSDTEFGTDESCTRAQVVTFLHRAAGCPNPKSATNPFRDVKKGSYYEKAVLWAVENGITYGTDATHFEPNEPCTRAEVVTFLWRYAGKPSASGKIPFTDVPAKAWYAQPVLWAVKNGVTYGVSATEFGTDEPCTRAQVVTFLYRVNT